MSNATTTSRVGTKVFNRGDMANPEHWGEIVSEKTDQWGSHVTIRVDEEHHGAHEPGATYSVPANMIRDHDKGNGLTRIVTEAARNARIRGQFEATLAEVEARMESGEEGLEESATYLRQVIADHS